ncbi:hypothetical protein M0802_010466 [Mischocyttarus mexicanus]|nr:hypothetical protein M0802_010466 [Mischocyttarus mexicanus]
MQHAIEGVVGLGGYVRELIAVPHSLVCTYEPTKVPVGIIDRPISTLLVFMFTFVDYFLETSSTTINSFFRLKIMEQIGV